MNILGSPVLYKSFIQRRGKFHLIQRCCNLRNEKEMMKLRPVHGVQLVSIDTPSHKRRGREFGRIRVYRRHRGRLLVRDTARAYFSVILAGKRDSRRHSTRSFGGNVLVWRKQSDQTSSNVRSFVIFFQ